MAVATGGRNASNLVQNLNWGGCTAVAAVSAWKDLATSSCVRQRISRAEDGPRRILQVRHHSLTVSRPCARSRSPEHCVFKGGFTRVRCYAHPENQSVSNDAGEGVKLGSQTKDFFGDAALIGSATMFSKLVGLLRETVLASVFGVGPIMNAYSYASIIPGFFVTLVGGLNGPLHSAVTASLSQRKKAERVDLLQRLNMIIGLVFAFISVSIFILAEHLVDAIAPGLMMPGYAEGLLTRNLAIIQLRVMAPCAVMAGLTGIGFGALSSIGDYRVPSLSPAFSSACVLVAVVVYVVQSPQITVSSSNATTAAVYLAAGATVGAFGQWGLQVVAQIRAGFKPLTIFRGRWRHIMKDEGICQISAVLVPAMCTSGMLQIATYTDLYFASFIPGGAAALGYANLLAMAPLGILSSAILVPLLRVFSRLSKPSQEPELQERVRQSLLLSMVATMLMTSIMVSLGRPIVRLVFERCAFDASASVLVSSLLICYVLGYTGYMARDLLVHVFYALGDGRFPFQVSMAAICANAALDWLLVPCAGYGVQGLVVATCLVNCGSAVALMVKLSSKLQGLQLRHWMRPLLLLGCSTTLSGMLTKWSYDWLFGQLLYLTSASATRYLWATNLLSVMLASAIGVVSYSIPFVLFRVPEMSSALQLLQSRL